MGQIGGGIMLPTLIAWALGKYAFEHRGRGMGFWGGAFFLGAFVSPPALTLVGQVAPGFLASVGVLGAVCLLLAAVTGWVGNTRSARSTRRSGARSARRQTGTDEPAQRLSATSVSHNSCRPERG